MNVTDLPQACISLIENVPGIDFIDEDFAIFDNIDDIPSLDHPMRIDAVVFALCTKGFMRIRINMEEYVVGRDLHRHLQEFHGGDHSSYTEYLAGVLLHQGASGH